ncbi:unnamed protein product [Lactuca virosa]|uniref:Uncharacterized protein n=1 Tax=Lactuca virosa TaxID=75947 RepID=A0AAU9M8U7_9ASTR|nr:unnamed protein product [Lactuca virosa]
MFPSSAASHTSIVTLHHYRPLSAPFPDDFPISIPNFLNHRRRRKIERLTLLFRYCLRCWTKIGIGNSGEGDDRLIQLVSSLLLQQLQEVLQTLFYLKVYEFGFLSHDLHDLGHSKQMEVPAVTFVMPLKGFGEHNLNN